MGHLPEAEIDENVTTITLKEGTIHLVYGVHNQDQKLPKEKLKLIQNTDGLVLEGDEFFELAHREDDLHTYASFEPPRQLISSFSEMEKTGKPVYQIEAASNEIDPLLRDDYGRTLWLMAIEEFLGGTIIAGGVFLNTTKKWIQSRNEKAKPQKIQKLSRRFILKTLAATFATWTFMPTVSALIQKTCYNQEKSFLEATTAQKIAQKVHPELFQILIKFRNLLIAYKLVILLQREKLKDVTMILGLGHVEIEDILIEYQQGDIALDDLATAVRELNPLPNSLTMCGITRYQFAKGGQWHQDFFYLPELSKTGK